MAKSTKVSENRLASSALPPPPLPRKRAKKGTAEGKIVEAAAVYFAEHGFRATTRELAASLGVTQALLYRYFPNKQALIDRVFKVVFLDRWDPERSAALLDSSRPLCERLTNFYARNATSPVRGRLFMRAGLDDQRLADLYTFPLNDRILFPAIAALRQEAGLPAVSKKAILRAERELVMTLHGAIAHLGIRRNIYRSPLPDDLSEHIAFYVEAFLAGALQTMIRIHRNPPRGALGVRLGRKVKE